jgi:hypothetical protein
MTCAALASNVARAAWAHKINLDVGQALRTLYAAPNASSAISAPYRCTT